MLHQGHELLKRGTPDFPIDLLEVTKTHTRYVMPYHWHNEVEIIHITSGTFTLFIDGKEVTAKAGSLFLVCPNQIHGGIPNECVYECLVIDSTIFSNTPILDYLVNHEINLNTTLLKSEYMRIIATLCEKKPHYKICCIGVIYQFFSLVMQNNITKKSNLVMTAIKDNQIKKVLAHIYDNYNKNLNLNELAQVIFLSPRYFCDFFTKNIGKSPIEYLNYYRIEKAVDFLLNKHLSITNVAFECGFNDVSYFIRTFKKYRGTTPKQFIINNKNHKTVS